MHGVPVAPYISRPQNQVTSYSIAAIKHPSLEFTMSMPMSHAGIRSVEKPLRRPA